MAAEGDNNIIWFTYTGADGELIDDEATHVIVTARVIRADAFCDHPNIVEVICNEDVEKIEETAFNNCQSLRRVIMRGVKVIEWSAFNWCTALQDVECDKLEIIGEGAFHRCSSLRSINLTSARIVMEDAFASCKALEDVESDKLEIIGEGAFWKCESLRSINLTSARIVMDEAFAGCKALEDVEFGGKLERIEKCAFFNCDSLERIIIPLKDGLISSDDIFQDCGNLKHIDLVEGELHETIAALQLEEWRNDLDVEINSINLILPNADPGRYDDDYDYVGEKAQTIRRWIRSVLHKIIHYQAEHRRLLEGDVATTLLELVLPNHDIVTNNVLPFLELPSYTFEVGNDEDEEDSSDDEMQSSDSSLGDEEEE